MCSRNIQFHIRNIILTVYGCTNLLSYAHPGFTHVNQWRYKLRPEETRSEQFGLRTDHTGSLHADTDRFYKHTQPYILVMTSLRVSSTWNCSYINFFERQLHQICTNFLLIERQEKKTHVWSKTSQNRTPKQHLTNSHSLVTYMYTWPCRHPSSTRRKLEKATKMVWSHIASLHGFNK